MDDGGVKGGEVRQETTMLPVCFGREEQINARGSIHFREPSGCLLSGWKTMIRVCVCMCV